MTNDSTSNALEALGGLDALEAQLEASEESAQQHTEEFTGGEFIQFDAMDGDVELSPWSYGYKGDIAEIHPDSTWAVDVMTMEHGWMGFEPDEDGQPIRGQRPDTLFVPWSQAVPDCPPTKKWMQKAFRWTAQCIESPIEGQAGVIGQVSDWRKMSRGFGNLERAVRERVRKAIALRGEGKEDEAKELLTRIHPVIRFKFDLKVKIPNRGKFNRAIIEQLPGEEGWAGVQAPKEEEGPKRRRRRA